MFHGLVACILFIFLIFFDFCLLAHPHPFFWVNSNIFTEVLDGWKFKLSKTFLFFQSKIKYQLISLKGQLY